MCKGLALLLIGVLSACANPAPRIDHTQAVGPCQFSVEHTRAGWFVVLDPLPRPMRVQAQLSVSGTLNNGQRAVRTVILHLSPTQLRARIPTEEGYGDLSMGPVGSPLSIETTAPEECWMFAPVQAAQP